MSPILFFQFQKEKKLPRNISDELPGNIHNLTDITNYFIKTIEIQIKNFLNSKNKVYFLNLFIQQKLIKFTHF